MAATTSTTHAREPATRSAPAASKDMAGTAPEHAASTKAAAEAGSDMLQTMSRMTYSGSYALAYGIVPVPGATDVDGVEVVLVDQPVEVDVGKGLARVRTPMAEQPRFYLLQGQRLLQQGVGLEV